MKKLVMLLAVSVGLTVFAGQDDKTITVVTSGDTYADGTAVVDGESYALVWIKNGQAFAGFNGDGTLKDAEANRLVKVSACAQDSGCNCTFQIEPSEFDSLVGSGTLSVFLLDTRARAGETAQIYAYGECVSGITGEGTVKVGGTVASTLLSSTPAVGVNGTTFSVANVLTYADGKTAILDGERFVLVKFPKGKTFQGIDWSYERVSDNDEIVDIFTTAKEGKCIDKEIEIASPSEDHDYAIVLVDSRVNGAISTVEGGDSPKFVSAWGECVLDANGKVASVKWHVVKLGLSASYPECQHEFDFDPTPYLAKGYAVVSPEEGKWRIYRLPQAWVEPFAAPKLTKSDNYYHLRSETEVPAGGFDLESAYKFSAFDTKHEDLALRYLQYGVGGIQTPEEAAVADEWFNMVEPFKKWNADFEVTFDRDVKADSVILAGYYHYTQAWAGKYTFDWVEGDNEPWVGSSPANDIKVGDAPIRLLASYIGKGGEQVTMTYEEICTLVVQFFCGVKNLKPENYGTTMTVKLCIYENTGRCNESGRRIVIGTYKYTFKGPLTVKFYENEVERTDLAISTNHDGTCEIQLPALKGGDEKTAFVGWSNRVNDVVYTNSLPARTWTPESRLDLYAAWQAAQTAIVSNDTGIVDKPVKVTDDWVKDVLNINPDKPAEVQEKLNEPVGTDEEKGKLKKWEAYVLGLDATDPNASVKVDQTAGAQEDKAIVLSTVQAPPPDSGFKVAYSLDKVEDNEETVKKTVDERTTNDLTIDLEPTDGETPTGYYKMNVIVTPDGADPIKYPAENTIGVLKVESEEKLVPVAVPWLSLEKGEEVLPNEIVDPRTLSEGDKLHVYNDNVSGQKDIYSTWIISGGAWVPVETVKIDNALQSTMLTKAAAREGSVRCGKGAWLERVDTTRPFYLIGQYDKAEEVSVQIKPPAEEGKVEYNLIAPTGIEDTDLNEIPSLTSADVDSKDQLMVMNKGVPTFLRPHEVSEGKTEWGYYKSVIDMSRGYPVVKQVWSTEAARVSAGLGLWYISSGGTPRIVWKEGKTEESK